MTEVYFEDIHNQIINQISASNKSLKICVAWFTDVEIFNELKLRKEAGVSVRIITSDESSNYHIMKDIESNFDLTKVPLKGNYLSNRLHDKFCIIDLEYVMHGSYNWSKNARQNDETLATALDRDFVKKFADEFMRLYNENR